MIDLLRHSPYLLLLLAILSFVLPRSTVATPSIEVLEDSIANASSPKKKAIFLRKLASAYRTQSPTKSDSVARIGLKIAQENGYSLLEGRILFQIANCYFTQSLFSKALAHYEQALIIHQKVSMKKPANLIRVAYVYNQMGLVNKDQGELDKALIAYLKALEIKEKFRLEKGDRYLPTTANTYINIGSIYGLLGQWENARDYHIQAYALLKMADNPQPHIEAAVYGSLSEAYLRLGQLGKATEFLEKQFAISSQEKSLLIEAQYFHNYALILSVKKEFSDALEAYVHSIKLYEELNSLRPIAEISLEVGDIYMKMNKPEDAKKWYQNAFQQSSQIQNHLIMGKAFMALSQWHEVQGNLHDALVYQKQFISQNDQVFTEKTIQALTELEATFSPDRSEEKQRLVLLNDRLKAKQSRLHTLILGLFALILAIGGVFFTLLHQKYHRQEGIQQNLKEENNHLLQKVLNQNILLTNLQEAKEELTQSHLSKDQLLSVISHDLRSQFGGILTFSQLLKDSGESFSKRELALYSQEFHQKAHQLYSLFDHLTRWCKSQIGQVDCKYESLTLGPIIKEQADFFQTKTRQKHISIEIDSENIFSEPVDVDPNMLKFILRNLIDNAIKFTPSGGEISIQTRQEGQNLWVEVSDTGRGIPEHFLAKILKPGTYSSTPGTANEKGAGLGLTLCNQFAKKMGGKLSFETEIGMGTVVSFPIKLRPEYVVPDLVNDNA